MGGAASLLAMMPGGSQIDARYAGLRRADASHADRAAFLIPLVLAQYDNCLLYTSRCV